MITLDPHQAAAVDWLEKRGWRGYLHMDPGTGKTFSACAAAERAGARKVLVFAPASVKDQWSEEVKAYFGVPAVVVAGDGDARMRAWIEPARFHVANYEQLINPRDYAHMKRVRWDMIVADEAHLVNNPTAKRTRKFKALDAPMRIAMSGTPTPNALHEAWSVVDWLEPGVLGSSFWSFRAAWCKVHPMFNKIVGYHDEEKLREIVTSRMFRVSRAVLELPGVKVRTVEVELGAEERARYEELLKQYRVASPAGVLTATHVLSHLLRLRQLIDDPQFFGLSHRAAKREALEGVLRESSAKTIVFTEWAELARRLQRDLGGAIVVGGQTRAERQRNLDFFKTDAGCTIMWMTSAGALGLNLTEAKRVVHMTLPWNYARQDQRLSRAHRRGQKDEVEEVTILAKGTVDAKMAKMVEAKRQLAEKMSVDDYVELLMND